MYLPDCILAPRSRQALPPEGQLWPSDDDEEEDYGDDGDDDGDDYVGDNDDDDHLCPTHSGGE